jgi:hypothetical protein
MVMLMMVAWGPRSMPSNVPPIRCPHVPPAIGKFIIWAMKMRALETAITGTKEWENIFLTPFQAHIKKASEMM